MMRESGIDRAAISVVRRLFKNNRRTATLMRPPMMMASRTLAIAVCTRRP